MTGGSANYEQEGYDANNISDKDGNGDPVSVNALLWPLSVAIQGTPFFSYDEAQATSAAQIVETPIMSF